MFYSSSSVRASTVSLGSHHYQVRFLREQALTATAYTPFACRSLFALRTLYPKIRQRFVEKKQNKMRSLVVCRDLKEHSFCPGTLSSLLFGLFFFFGFLTSNCRISQITINAFGNVSHSVHRCLLCLLRAFLAHARSARDAILFGGR